MGNCVAGSAIHPYRKYRMWARRSPNPRFGSLWQVDFECCGILEGLREMLLSKKTNVSLHGNIIFTC